MLQDWGGHANPRLSIALNMTLLESCGGKHAKRFYGGFVVCQSAEGTLRAASSHIAVYSRAFVVAKFERTRDLEQYLPLIYERSLTGCERRRETGEGVGEKFGSCALSTPPSTQKYFPPPGPPPSHPCG